MTVLWSILTSRLAGPIAAGVAVLLALMLGVTSIRLSAAQHTASEALQARDRAVASLATCQANTRSLEGAVAAQNAAVEGWREAGDAKVKVATEKLTVAIKGRAAAEARAAALMRPAVGVDACARMESADAAILRVLK